MAKKRYMQNVRPLFVSLVSKAANRREFLTRKDEDGHDIETVQVPILKSEDVDGVRYVTSVVYEPGVVDTQGDQMTAQEIEKAAHLYMRDYQGVDVQHSNRQEPGCWVAESSILKADTEIGGQKVPAGAWIMTTGIENADIVAKIDSGDLNGVSIGGFAQFVLKADTTDSEETPPKWFQKLWTALVDRFGMKEPKEPEAPEPQGKGGAEQDEPAPEKPEKGEKTVKKSEFAEIMSGLGEALIAKGVMVDDAPEGAASQTPPTAPVEKSDPQPQPQPDIAAIIKSAIAEGFAEVAKASCGGGKDEDEKKKKVAKSDPEPSAPDTITTDQLTQIVKSAVDEQIAPLQQTVNMLSSAYNVGPKNLNGTSQPVEKSAEPHYMDGFFSE